jgi:hypothetical protein
MNIAVVAAEGFCKGAHTGNVVPTHVMQQFDAFACHHACLGVLAFECKMAFLQGIAAFGAVPRVHEAL